MNAAKIDVRALLLCAAFGKQIFLPAADSSRKRQKFSKTRLIMRTMSIFLRKKSIPRPVLRLAISRGASLPWVLLMPLSPCVIVKSGRISWNHELVRLVGVGICQHRDPHVDSRPEPGRWHDPDEYSLSARHNFYAGSRPGKIHWISSTFCKWMAFFVCLRSGISIAGKIDMVVGRTIWNRAGDFRSCRGSADLAGLAPANG